MSDTVNCNPLLLKTALELERQFAYNNYLGQKQSTYYKYIQGDIPIVLSAPHAVKHIRNGKIKSPDLFTGSLALLLAKLTGCHVIYRTFMGNGDSNHDLNCNYKTDLLKKINDYHIKCLIDLHGLHRKRDLMIDVGTLNGLSITTEIRKIIVESFKSQNILDLRFDYLFNANKAGIVVHTIWHNLGISSFQLEINGIYRDIYYREHWENFHKIVASLQSLILNIHSHYRLTSM